MLNLLREAGFRPKRCVWEITLACHLRCGHCGSRAGRARRDELTTEEAYTVIDDLARLGCQRVTLSGGEPTLRTDWPLLMKRLTSRGLGASCLSNGVVFTPEMAQTMLDAGATQVAFSLDGLRDSHEAVRGGRDSYGKVLRAIDTAREAGLRVGMVTHITKHNLAEVEAIHQLLRQHRVGAWQVQQGIPIGNLSEHRDTILTGPDMLDLIPRLAALAESKAPPRIHPACNIGYYGEHEVTLRSRNRRIPFWVGCLAGLRVLGVESHGDVKGCLSLPSELNGRSDFVEGNVRERSLVEIWCDPERFSYNRRFQPTDLGGQCAGCDYGDICRGGCSVTSIGHSGRPHTFPNCYYAQHKQ